MSTSDTHAVMKSGNNSLLNAMSHVVSHNMTSFELATEEVKRT